MPRARTTRRLAITLVVVLVLTAAVIAADWWVRGQVADRIQHEVEQSLGLPAGEARVEVAGFSALAQLASGRLEHVRVGLDEFTTGEVTGRADLVATGIPLDTGQPVETVRVEFTAEPDAVAAVLPNEDVELGDAELRVTRTLNLLGVQVGIVVGLEPRVQDGKLVLTPTSVDVNGSRSSAEELRARFGAVADTVLQPRTVCVARWLPRDLTLIGVRVTPAALTLSLQASDVVLSGLGRLGECPEG